MGMRGNNKEAPQMFCMFHLEAKIRKDHPLRRIKQVADQVLNGMNSVFDKMYSNTGRPSIPPEVLLKSQLLIALYTVRSERLFCEKLETDMLFRWFLDMDADGASFDHSVFSWNRDRLLEHDVAADFFDAVVDYARKEDLLSDDHFTVDGTLIESLASMKSFRRKDDSDKSDGNGWKGKNPDVDFHGEERKNETHESTTDPTARLYKKGAGQESKLCYIGNALMENRHGLCVGFQLNTADGHGEREGAKELIKRARRRGFGIKTLGGDKNYGTNGFVDFLRQKKIRSHVSCRSDWKILGLDGRTTRHRGYEISVKKRKMIEQKFGWIKTVGGMLKSRFFGQIKTEMWGLMSFSAYNILRIAKLREAPS